MLNFQLSDLLRFFYIIVENIINLILKTMTVHLLTVRKRNVVWHGKINYFYAFNTNSLNNNSLQNNLLSYCFSYSLYRIKKSQKKVATNIVLT